MNLIENVNTLGCCNEQNCSRPATYYDLIKYNGLWVYVSLCVRCKDIWEKEGRKNE